MFCHGICEMPLLCEFGLRLRSLKICPSHRWVSLVRGGSIALSNNHLQSTVYTMPSQIMPFNHADWKVTNPHRSDSHDWGNTFALNCGYMLGSAPSVSALSYKGASFRPECCVPTRDCRNIQNDRTGDTLAGAHHSSSAQWMVQHEILAESKRILAEPDLILLRRIPRSGRKGTGEEVLSSELVTDGKRGGFAPCPSLVPSCPSCGDFDSRLSRQSR